MADDVFRAPRTSPQATDTRDPSLPEEVNFEFFELKIYNQVGLVFNGQVKALESANDQGEFSILPGHTNFISLIKQPVMIYPQEGKPKKIEVGLGVIRVLYNKVEIFSGLLVNKDAQALAEELQAQQSTGTDATKAPPTQRPAIIPEPTQSQA